MAKQRRDHYKDWIKKNRGKSSFSFLGEQLTKLKVIEPLNGNEVKVCLDSELTPKFGSGISSVSPAHFIDDLKLAQV